MSEFAQDEDLDRTPEDMGNLHVSKWLNKTTAMIRASDKSAASTACPE